MPEKVSMWRRLVCLILVCCLMFNIATIPARASAAAITATVIGVSAALVVGSILIGTGVSPGSETTDFDTVVGNCVDYLSDAGTWVVDGLCTVFALTNGTYKYAVDEGLIDTVRNWLFDTAYVAPYSTGDLFSRSVSGSLWGAGSFVSGNDDPFQVYYFTHTMMGTTYTYNLFVSDVENNVALYDSLGGCIVSLPSINLISSGLYYRYWSSSNVDSADWDIPFLGNYNSSVDGSESVVIQNLIAGLAGSYITAHDLTLTSLASPSVSIATGYADWAAPAVGIDDSTETETGTYDVLYTYGTYIEDGGTNNGTSGDEEDGDKTLKWLYPLGLAATLSEQLALTQEQVQAGESTYEYQDPDTGTDTESDTETNTGNSGSVEQSAADAQGNAGLEELLGVVPDQSAGFMDAVSTLAGAMSYTGTAAVLTIPAIILPSIPGVMSSIQLTPEQQVDLGAWAQQMPAKVLSLVQALLTLALIGYCFKELYSTFAYMFTLKGGKE